jgi:alpha,alpha-trehalase
MPAYSPITKHDGYYPIRDYGLIGDGSATALIARDGRLDWLCVPRFDSPPLICGILDAERGGEFSLTPIGLQEARHYYKNDTPVLVTEMKSNSGVVRLTDALTLKAGSDLSQMGLDGRSELLRTVEVIEGQVEVRFRIRPRGGAKVEPRSGGLSIQCSAHPGLELQLFADIELKGLEGKFHVREGQPVRFWLRWGETSHLRRIPGIPDPLQTTERAWKDWLAKLEYEGPHLDQVRRSALVLKLLDYGGNGAIVAAPTSSLPETIGGGRNWDYRYAWVRDAAFSVYALRRIGYRQEAWYFLRWVLDVVERGERADVLYDLDGTAPEPEFEDEELEGYRGSRPVRWGNAASGQRQHDVYGEILDCAYQWVSGGQELDPEVWARLRHLVETAGRKWREPDRGIWEIRASNQPFTYSIALCHVALDRGAKLAEGLKLSGPTDRWKSEAAKIRKTILEEAWNPELRAITASPGKTVLDASVLTLPLRRVVEASHPRMVATTEAIRSRLGAGSGLLYRYNPDEFDDGLTGKEGAFVLCSFWLVDNLANQGKLEEAQELFDSLCSRTNDLGLLPEQIDPGSGDFLGNYPQAFSHVGLISSAFNLARRSAEQRSPHKKQEILAQPPG